LAMEWYQHFVDLAERRENCIINTKYNPELNPV